MKELAKRLLGRAGLESTIARNSVLLLAAEGFGRAANLVISIVLYRYLQPEGAGAYRFVLSYGVLFGICAELGLMRAAVREIAEETGLSVTSLKLLAVHDFQRQNQVIVTYLAQAQGEIRLSPELAEYKLLPPEKVKCWPAGTGLAMADWLRSLGIEPEFVQVPA